MGDLSIKKGDEIVENGRVHKIFKIEQLELNGKPTTVAFFKPVYKSTMNNQMVSSIPVKNILKTNIRRPISKATIKEITARITRRSLFSSLDIRELKSKFNENSFKVTAIIVKTLLAEKKEKERLAPTKKSLLEKSLRSISEEFAYAHNKDLESAHKSITRALA